MSRIRHIALATQDPDKTAKFYRDVFDLQEVGRVNNENAEGVYLSDGHINLAVLRFKSDVVAGDAGTTYSGIHHFGFQVEDASAADGKLKGTDSFPMDSINSALHAGMGTGHGGKNVELKYSGPDGVMIDISQGGWVGTNGG